MRDRKLPLGLLATVVICLAGTSAQADVWRWVDGTGRIHYSDVPVEGAVRVKATSQRPSSSGGASSSGPSSPPLANRVVAINERTEGDAAKRAMQSDLAKKRAEQCKEASERYDRAIAARRLYREGKSGERVYLTEAEIEQSRVDARRDRDAVCNPGATPR